METQNQTTTTTAVRPFRVDMPDEALADLRQRISATHFPDKELVADASQGVQLAMLQELARYWSTDYDFRRLAERLNALPQFKTEIDGLDIHFIHVKSRHANALPLIITHGWPGSVIEMLEVIGPLTDPTAHGGSAEDAFELVLPSIPGYGFSGEPMESGWGPDRIARAWAELMTRLGYTRYVAQGGDQGANVTDAMGRLAPKGLGHSPQFARLFPACSAGRDLRRQYPRPGGTAQAACGSRYSRHSQQRTGGIQSDGCRVQEGLLRGDGRAPTDGRLLVDGLAGRARSLDARPRPGQLPEDLARVRRRLAGGRLDPRQDPR